MRREYWMKKRDRKIANRDAAGRRVKRGVLVWSWV